MSSKVMLVFGTRPEAIKMCPLVNELAIHSASLEPVVCVTGQHREMLDSVLKLFKIWPKYDLRIMHQGQSLFDITAKVLTRLKEVMEAELPDIVLVHGDTTTTFAAALACFYLHIPIGHVEAGLRTGRMDSPWPEEFNRQAVDLLASLFFAPTDHAKSNLLSEGKCADRVFVTGNTGIDALRTTVCSSYRDSLLDWADDSRLILITAHRRENLGDRMRLMFRGIREAMDERPDTKAIFPAHLNPMVRQEAFAEFEGFDRIRVVNPLDVLVFHNYLAKCYLVLTDSGGIQEEAPSLGKPVIVMRDTTERPEGLKAGTLMLAGTTQEGVYNALAKLLDDSDIYQAMSRASNPYGDGYASKRIVEELENWIRNSN